MTKNETNSWNVKVRPLYLLAIILSIGLGTIVLLPFAGGGEAVFAESGDMQKTRNTYPQIVDTRLDSCNLCHTGSEWRLNSYGRDYKQQGRNLTAISDWDSDNDSYNNIVEINALTFPGDASDAPLPEPTAKPQTNLTITKHVDKATPLPGDTIVYTLIISNIGSATAADITVIDKIPAAIIAPTWTHSAALDGIVARAGENFSWELPDMAPGVEGIITVSGELKSDLSTGSTVVNTAEVSSSGEDIDGSDNEDEVFIFVGGHELYLPVTLRD